MFPERVVHPIENIKILFGQGPWPEGGVIKSFNGLALADTWPVGYCVKGPSISGGG